MELSEQMQVSTYEQAKALVEAAGLLPLAALIPAHPFLQGVTKPECWHTGKDSDPWGWRVRFPADGTAGYGKFVRKKAVFVSAAWFPAFAAALGSTLSPEERYKQGLLSREGAEICRIVREQPGIDTRELRTAAGLRAQEHKSLFDRTVAELQGSLDIVISGVHVRLKETGEQNGWNSTSYETVEHWMKQSGLRPFAGTAEEAAEWLCREAESAWTEEAASWLRKTIRRQR